MNKPSVAFGASAESPGLMILIIPVMITPIVNITKPQP